MLRAADTHSPFMTFFLCLRNIAMTVPMIAKIIMTPMMAPMMLPVVGPSAGRGVPGKNKEIGKVRDGDDCHA